MSNAAGGSKKNKPNDANHVNAETKAYQQRMTEIRKSSNNDSNKS
ncbi:hypothetical protein ACFVHQ_11830 [Actinomycetes bacterium NPDC127524]